MIPHGYTAGITALALLSLSVVIPACPAWAQAGPAPSELKRPVYQIGSAGRFNEDWSVLRGVDLGTTDDVWDSLKFIPLSPDQNVWLTIGFAYYHRARTHLSLDKDAPDGRPIEPPELGAIIPIPEVGGLHHRYVPRAA